MKRSGPLRRLTPLKAKTPIKRTQWVRHRTKEQPGWAKAVAAVRKRSGGRCELRSPDCIGVGHEVHHLLNRSQGGTADVDLLRHACRPCHSWVGVNVAEAYSLGLLLHRWQVHRPD